MAFSGTGLWGTTQTVVYNGGNIPSTYWVNPSTTKSAEEPGLLSVSIPVGKKIDYMDVQYSISTNNGSWSLLVHFEDIPIVLTAPAVTFSAPEGVPLINWTAVANARSYRIYGSDNPFSTVPWRLADVVPASTLSYSPFLSGTKNFFRVTASSDLP